MKRLLEIVSVYSHDIGMSFGERKCNFVEIKRGKLVSNSQAIEIAGVKISPVQLGDTYRYLGLDECVTFNGPLNKERVTSEYLKRARRV